MRTLLKMRGADRGSDPFAVDALHTLLGLYVLFVTYWGKGQLCPDPFLGMRDQTAGLIDKLND